MNSKLSLTILVSCLVLFNSKNISSMNEKVKPNTPNARALGAFFKRKKLDIRKTKQGANKTEQEAKQALMNDIASKVFPDIREKDVIKDRTKVINDIFNALFEDVNKAMDEPQFRKLLRSVVIPKYNAIRGAMEAGDFAKAKLLRKTDELESEETLESDEGSLSDGINEIEEETDVLPVSFEETTPVVKKSLRLIDQDTPKGTPNTNSLIKLLERKKIDVKLTAYENANSLELALCQEVDTSIESSKLMKAIHEKLYCNVERAMTKEQFNVVIRNVVGYKYPQIVKALEADDQERAEQLRNNTENGEIKGKPNPSLPNEKIKWVGGIITSLVALYLINNYFSSTNRPSQTVY